ncbi:hypothetical protein FOL46_002397 [Perkinsus olseni]|uniref:Integrase catalytic domain-containing protein n=2 Tax=Perkinsus olseni TaxID=32597 RepID=A0A7J6KQL1_PEROL|nr:hypothetical protein FOL46_002397 [Perkinsus olseni]
MGLLLSRQFRSDGEDDHVPVIPSGELQDELIEKVHLGYNHPGISRMVRLVRQMGWFKGLYCAIKRFVLQCAVCAQAKEGKMLSKALSTVKNFIPMIWGVVGLDLFGPLRLQNGTKCWVLIAVCYISRLVAVRVIDSPSAASAVAGFIEIVGQEGVPKLVVHDQGLCFMSATFKEILAQYNVGQAYTNSYDAAQRGWIERCHAEFGALLRTYQLEAEKRMQDMNDARRWCSMAAFTMNCLPYSDSDDTRLCPWTCCRASRGIKEHLLGDEAATVEQIQEWLGSGLLFQDLTDNVKQVTDDCKEEWARSLEHLKELWLERRAEIRRKLSRRRRPHNDQLKEGDTVWKRNFAADKLNALFTGPYTVVKIVGGNVTIEDSDKKTSTATIDQLKKGLPSSRRKIKTTPATKTVATQVEKDALEPQLDEEDLRRWRDVVTGQTTVLTRSRKRLLEKVDNAMNKSKAPRKGD